MARLLEGVPVPLACPLLASGGETTPAALLQAA